MKLIFAVSERFDKYLKSKRDNVARAATLAMEAASEAAKDDIRAEVQQEFKSTPAVGRKRGQNFAKSFRNQVYPNPKRRKWSLGPATLLYALSRFASIFQTGGKVEPAEGAVIALPAARKLGLDRTEKSGGLQKRSDVEAAVDRFGLRGGLLSIPAKGGFMLAADRQIAMREGLKVKRGLNFVPLFFVQKIVRLPKKLRFNETVKKWAAALPRLYSRYFKDG